MKRYYVLYHRQIQKSFVLPIHVDVYTSSCVKKTNYFLTCWEANKQRKLSIRYEFLLSMLGSLRFNQSSAKTSADPSAQKHFDLQWLGSPQLRPPRFGTKQKPSAFHKPPGSPERHVAADILSTWVWRGNHQQRIAWQPNQYKHRTHNTQIIYLLPLHVLHQTYRFLWHWHILKLHTKVAFHFHPSNLLGQAHSWARYS